MAEYRTATATATVAEQSFTAEASVSVSEMAFTAVVEMAECRTVTATATVTEQSFTAEASVSEMAFTAEASLAIPVVSASVLPHYKGEYEITPSIETQKLATSNKVMDKDITVFKIPYFETSNVTGTTVYIAERIGD